MRKSLYLFLTLLLVGCSNTVSSTNSSSKISSSNSSVTSSSSVNSSVISSSSSSSSSSTVEEDKLEFEKEETSRKLILSSTNKTNTAYSSWEAEYLENGIQITSYVYDEDVFYGNIYNCGYDDNVEFLINVKNNESGWMIDGTYHFLINADGKMLFEVAKTPNGLSGSMIKEMGVVLGENLITEFKRLTIEDGYVGYYSKVFIDYKFFGEKEDVVGNLTFCPGMRNSHNYQVDSSWSAYSKRGCKWGSASTFVLINEDGTFGERLSMDLDTLYLGDTLFDKGNWSTYYNDALNEVANNISISSSNIKYWQSELEYYKDSKIDKVVIYLGTNDLNNANVVNDLKSLFTQIKGYFSNVKIYYVSLIVTPSLLDNNELIKNINAKIKEYSENNDSLSYIDVYNKIYINEEIRQGLFRNDTSLNYLGYNILVDEIHKALKLNKLDLPNMFGSNSLYASSNSFRKITNNNLEYVEGTGDKDQYLFFSKEPSTNIEAKIKLSAVEAYNGDGYPKFGFALVGDIDTLFYYVDGSNGLTKQNVGYVRGKNNISWQWALSVEKQVEITYNNNSFVELKVVYNNSIIELYCENSLIFTVEDFFAENEKLSVSILSFNTHLLLKDYEIN